MAPIAAPLPEPDAPRWWALLDDDARSRVKELLTLNGLDVSTWPDSPPTP